jgi:hypothetical protein
MAAQGSSAQPEGAWIGQGKSAKPLYDGHVVDFPYNAQSNLPSCNAFAPSLPKCLTKPSYNFPNHICMYCYFLTMTIWT